MTGEYNIWNKWDPLKTVMLGDCYAPEFFRDIKNNKIKSALTQITEETQEDLEYYESVLKDFGCDVLRPKLDKNDSILNYINQDGQVSGIQGVPRSPLQPRDCQLVVGNDLVYTGQDHCSIKQCLDQYNAKHVTPYGPLIESKFNNYKGNNAPDWPTYEEYLDRYLQSKSLSDNHYIDAELVSITRSENLKFTYFPVSAPSITVIGKDLYIDRCLEQGEIIDDRVFNFYMQNLAKHNNFKINKLTIGGHSDGCFHAIKPGALLSLREIQTYENTFPGWDVCYLPDQSWNKVKGFLKIKKQVNGKWWLPGEENNTEFTYFVETWLQDWVGYVEETVFDVNVLVLDEHHVCVNNMNPVVIDFLKKHNMEPVHVPWRHRYFWDGGLHCITLDLYREGQQQDYFPDRKKPIVDYGFE